MMNAELVPAIMLIGFGLLLVIVGLLHNAATLNQWDTHTFQFLHTRLRRYAGFFRYIWPLGTTPVGITLILIIFIASWQAGLIIASLYLLTAILEHNIKRSISRPRPFKTLPNVEMTQPKEPHDPSHPSGDTMRVFLLAVVFPWAFALSWPVYVATLAAAAILGLGRVVLGVHYPLDVIGGAGLGLLAAGVAIVSYQIIVL
jgi:undecaprenyl-diphosphatase